jgi:hypothetical protein
VVTGIELGLERLALETAIQRARALLLRLVDQHRLVADRLTASTSRTYNLRGEHIR